MRRLRLSSLGIAVCAAVIALTVSGGVAPLQAATIPTLFSTGVDGAGAPLADGSVDPHYTIAGGFAFAIGCPTCVGWIGNTPSSSWISPDPGTRAGGGPFTYLTTFDLTGFDLSHLVIHGTIAADDQASILLNGVDVFDSVSTFSEPWSFFESFALSSGFLPGINTLEIFVPNNIESPNDGPTGVQLQLSTAVPEPVTLTLIGAGILSLGFVRRRVR